MLRRNLIATFNATRSYTPVKKPGATKRTFNNIRFDADGKFLVLHHFGASWYYKVNLLSLGLFYGATLYNYVMNS